MKKLMLINNLLLLALLSLPLTLNAKTYYVNASRPNDLGNGESWDTAKKTIMGALACNPSGEDIVEISGGNESVTYRELVELQNGGSDGHYLTLKASKDPGHDGEVIIANEGTNWVNIWIHVDAEFPDLKILFSEPRSRSLTATSSNRSKNGNYTRPSRWHSTSTRWSNASERASSGWPRH